MAFPEGTRERFLEMLAETGSVTRTSRALAVPRMTLYRWRWDDEDFADAWDMALEAHREGMRERVEETAEAIGLGRWRNVTDAHGRPAQHLVTDHVDVRLLIKLMDKTMRDEVRTLDQRTSVSGSFSHAPVTIELRNPDGSVFEPEEDA